MLIQCQCSVKWGKLEERRAGFSESTNSLRASVSRTIHLWTFATLHFQQHRRHIIHTPGDILRKIFKQIQYDHKILSPLCSFKVVSQDLLFCVINVLIYLSNCKQRDGSPSFTIFILHLRKNNDAGVKIKDSWKSIKFI